MDGLTNVPQAAIDHYRKQQRLAVVTVANARRLWSQMGDDFDASWRTVGPRLVALISAAQLAAARGVEEYLAAVLDETDQPDRPVGKVIARAFAGVAPDGRSLDGLLVGAVIRSKTADSVSAADALGYGGRWLDMASQTIVADTSRNATSVAIAARPDIGGYVRMVNTPACSRCIILGGKFFRWNTGFARHPNCDCRHIPSSENVAGDIRTDPAAYFKSLSTVDQNATFTPAGAQAIRDGADINQVVNARQGMQTAGGQLITTQGTTVRALAGKRLSSEGVARPAGARYRTATNARLMPESIYAQAANREEAITALRRFGFLA